MHFIGIAFAKTDSVDFNLVSDKAAESDLIVSKTFGKGPFYDGLMNFSDFTGMDIFQCFGYNEDDRTLSSRKISDDLMAYHREPGENNFLNFLNAVSTAIPTTFQVIFAADWAETAPVRFEKIPANELGNYFRRNNSWYLWLYNYSAQRYYPKLDLPLILDVTKE